MLDRLVNMTNVNLDSLRVDTTSWGDQFRNAMNVNGGDLESATHLDYFMHFMTFGFKVRVHLLQVQMYTYFCDYVHAHIYRYKYFSDHTVLVL